MRDGAAQTPAPPHLFLPPPCKSVTDPASPVSLRIRDQRAYVVSEASAGVFASRAIHSFRTVIVSVWLFFAARHASPFPPTTLQIRDSLPALLYNAVPLFPGSGLTVGCTRVPVNHPVDLGRPSAAPDDCQHVDALFCESPWQIASPLASGFCSRNL